MNVWEVARAILDGQPDGFEVTHLSVTDGKTVLSIEPQADWYERQGYVPVGDPVDVAVTCAQRDVLNAALDLIDDGLGGNAFAQLAAAVDQYRDTTARLMEDNDG